MATEITMPQLSDTMDKGTILKWFKREGDNVSRGDALAEVATDKADLEIESFHEGVLLKINAPEGETVSVGSLIAVIGSAGEKVESAPIRLTEKAEEPTPPSTTNLSTSPSESINFSSNGKVTDSKPFYSGENLESKNAGERIKISPLAKNIAKSHGVDYASLSGTGDGGRIVRRDVEKALSTGINEPHQIKQSESKTPLNNTPPQTAMTDRSSITSSNSASVRIEPLSKMRETIAARMVESVNTAPHFFATSRIEVSSLLKCREVLKNKPEYEGITVTHLITKAVGLSLRAFPRINSRYENGQMVEPQQVNIGIITALPDGLLIPVIKNADLIPLSDIVSDSRAMVQRARSGKPKADDLQGGTFSISNIGKNEVEHFTAIINPGQGAILAVSSIQDEAVVKDGTIIPGKTMRVTLSVDHRIIDGVVAGEFLTHLKGLLEEPVLILA
ncbi:MAG TPA: dihydrolipoamide acetyltransferase family protein [Oligoflexia bacterium]|nr:dihydrolipoamide acetyltransferase family protein [Oligoflexia bacterium]HMP48334.1 dihydrolipoamide acetyltransferase family protein [Oligoflexia bacterium]